MTADTIEERRAIAVELRRLADTIEHGGELLEITEWDFHARLDTERGHSPDRGRTPTPRVMVAEHTSVRLRMTKRGDVR